MIIRVKWRFPGWADQQAAAADIKLKSDIQKTNVILSWKKKGASLAVLILAAIQSEALASQR